MAWFNCNTAIAQFKAVKIDKEKADIVNFYSNVGDVIIPEVKPTITPVQSGSGDPAPDNIRPISGWDSVKVSAVKQLFNGTLENGSFNTGTGEKIPSTTRVRSVDDIPLPSGSYVLNNLNGWQFVLYVYDLEGNFKSSESYISWKDNPLSFSLVADRKINFAIRNDTNTTIVPSDVIGLTLYDSTVGQTATIPLPHTVYGGELDIVSGSGSETHQIVDLGTKPLNDFNYNSSANCFYIGGFTNKKRGYRNLLCSAYATRTNDTGGNWNLNNCEIGGAMNSDYVYLKNTDYTSTSDLKNSLNGVLLVYELATPTALTTSPVALQARNGTNNVWSDCGQTSLKYYEMRRATT